MGVTPLTSVTSSADRSDALTSANAMDQADAVDRSDGGAGGKATGLPRLLVPVIAVCCGVTVANIYLGQPLLTLIQARLGVSAGAAGWVATLGQLGYALGVLLFLPLGDVVRRRPLLLALLAGTVGALGVAAGARSLPMLLVA